MEICNFRRSLGGGPLFYLWLVALLSVLQWSTTAGQQIMSLPAPLRPQLSEVPITHREGYFNGTSTVRLKHPLSLLRQIGLSFRTCSGGNLFTQNANGYALSLSVSEEGILLRVTTPKRTYDSKISAHVLVNTWHNVALTYRLGDLTLTAAGHSVVVANSTYNTDILLSANQFITNAVLVVGGGFIGCILQGPSIVFNASSMDVSNVQWGQCALNSKSCSHNDFCGNAPCTRGGSCYNLQDRYECICSPRYHGKNCELDYGSPCLKNPPSCKNNGTCKDDDKGNYLCICDPEHTGQHCEAEVSTHLCVNNPCQNGATCQVEPGGQQSLCICLPGFAGPYCEVNINDCQPNPCQNGGVCKDGINSYSCNCARTGYTGTRCDIDIDECLNTPCHNNGACFNNYGSYTCVCEPGYSGQNCEMNVNECSSEPCLNGAKCIDKLGSYECKCIPGYTGPHCESNINECEIAPCPANSECVDGENSFECVCKVGLTGKPPNCSEVNVCTNNPCSNGGSCIVVGDHYNCSCAAGFEGKTCEIDLDECSTNPCKNGGVCIDSINGYVCNCTDEFMGKDCEKEFDACAFNPCKNGGTCGTKPRRKEYYCDCPPGFTDLECATDLIDDCLNATCPAGYECVDGINSYDCVCSEGSAGENCTARATTTCSENPCSVNGSCREVNGVAECVCKPGFEGPTCSDDIDECKRTQDLCNNGICINNVGSYNCFCKPGFTGDHCHLDFDECLSKPCQNNASCENLINSFNCICTAGYSGKECEIDIDECESDPCLNNATCVDGVASFSCSCQPGFTGQLCETNIDDCESAPCLNGGMCLDGINSFACNCSGTGYEGHQCETNIDDCLNNPCTNGAECRDAVNDYTCDCYPGYTGKNCEVDINECESSPCKYNGTCLERSNRTLYKTNDLTLPAIFSQEFSYETAGGHVCTCVFGTTGPNCEIDINECESSPCKWGTCINKIGAYDCECEPGFMGVHCEVEIDECELYKPCEHGECYDRRANYTCECDPKYGGKNCSVELTGCLEGHCKNNGTCKPYLENETEHRFNCSCQTGFHGHLCELVTSMSFSGKSLGVVQTTREEGYDIQFRFKTTLPQGLLAIGKGTTFYILELAFGRLNLHSSLLNKWDGVNIGSNLNNSEWQKVFVAINSSHLVLAANEEQTIYPIMYIEGSSSNTAFPTTYLGGTVPSLRQLAHGPPYFIGCLEDVVINGNWVLPEESSSAVTLDNLTMGCPRTDQCKPNPCFNGGHCTDLWSNFSCTCERPFLGHTCQYNFTAATFGHENITNSLVAVSVYDFARRAVRSIVDISMFVRTRQNNGVIFQLGSSPSVDQQNQTQIAAMLDGGELFLGIQFNGTPEGYTVGGVRLDDGNNHLIEVVRNVTLVQVKINGSEYFRKTISASGQLDVQLLYLGGVPPNARVNFRPSGTPDYSNFKGIIQDVQISNGSRTMVVEFFPLRVDDLVVPPFGNISFNNDSVLEGVISDDTCSDNPCLHNGTCIVTWNDFLCECVRGYKGKTCLEVEFCQLQDCPNGSICRNLNDGHECVANATFNGVNATLTYDLMFPDKLDEVSPPVSLGTVDIQFRTLTGGTILHISAKDKEDYFSVAVNKEEVYISWKFGQNRHMDLPFRRERNEGKWSLLSLRMQNDVLQAGFPMEESSEEVTTEQYQVTQENFPTALWQSMLSNAQITLGGVVSFISRESPADPVDLAGHAYTHAELEVEGPGTRASVENNDVESESRLLGNNTNYDSYFFKGCLGEVRIGEYLLPYFTQTELNITVPQYVSLINSVLDSGVNIESGCVLCFDGECQHGGKCFNANESYACSCPPGYEGDMCEVDIDECVLDNRCKNNATCHDAVANITCQCQPGWDGWLCNHDINECESNPCQNGGTCKDLLARYECLCTEEYEGTDCEAVKIITCDNNPCRNGSVCNSRKNPKTGDNFTCECADGFVGRYCDVPYCFETRCQFGDCDLSQQFPKCVCHPGYNGTYCEKDIDDCAEEPCKHNATCIDAVNSFICLCDGPGYTGPTCSDDVNECEVHRGLCGRGQCLNTEGSYRCLCPPGKCGNNCSLEDPCIVSPCENGGTCMEVCKAEPIYECKCTEGHKGMNCTETPLFARNKAADIAMIVVPIVAALLLAGAISLFVLVMMARKKRATRGTYSPSQQEYCNPRVELDNVMKPPPEERLI